MVGLGHGSIRVNATVTVKAIATASVIAKATSEVSVTVIVRANASAMATAFLLLDKFKNSPPPKAHLARSTYANLFDGVLKQAF